ncbi:hypothetical protein E2562_015986 [Oryza meyeriana var. granulata]|uniref:Uncharacterized protein n=1 Tax=Oryza meyeriana var. granulata TaxID=110450 RepID=A0A6G1EKE2_9ORYZ|nr:hypothetical protein E2562_015986 [Oryza meyeriana var. granulata]
MASAPQRIACPKHQHHTAIPQGRPSFSICREELKMKRFNFSCECPIIFIRNNNRFCTSTSSDCDCGCLMWY